ncbi:MAG: hypothetical protein F6K42_34135, partial [Leptolyngbya sp. SIO1D8]|nr:hypothetical protein [Leptolyngbya sp. SIO1D8]
MPQDTPNHQPDSVTDLSQRGVDDADALGPEYRQRITPIGQSFLAPKRLEPISRPNMAVLNMAPGDQPLSMIQQWPLETVDTLGEGVTETSALSPNLFASDNTALAVDQTPAVAEQAGQSVQRFQEPAVQAAPSQANSPEPPASQPQQDSNESGESASATHPGLQRQPTPPPVQVSEPVRLPTPTQRSPQLQRQVKNAKSKALQFLQAQSPPAQSPSSQPSSSQTSSPSQPSP